MLQPYFCPVFFGIIEAIINPTAIPRSFCTAIKMVDIWMKTRPMNDIIFVILPITWTLEFSFLFSIIFDLATNSRDFNWLPGFCNYVDWVGWLLCLVFCSLQFVSAIDSGNCIWIIQFTIGRVLDLSILINSYCHSIYYLRITLSCGTWL